MMQQLKKVVQRYNCRLKLGTKHCLIGFTTDMTLEHFQQRHLTGVAEKPKLFALIPADPPASIEQIAETERLLGVQLPAKYRQFLSVFGGGSFGLTNIFSACSDSDFYLPMRCEESRNYLPDDLVPFSDDGAGEHYVMKVSGQALGDAVFYWNRDAGLDTTEFEDIFGVHRSIRIRCSLMPCCAVNPRFWEETPYP